MSQDRGRLCLDELRIYLFMKAYRRREDEGRGAS